MIGARGTSRVTNADVGRAILPAAGFQPALSNIPAALGFAPIVHIFVHSIVAVVWDPEKLVRNIGKHGIRFAEAVLVFED